MITLQRIQSKKKNVFLNIYLFIFGGGGGGGGG